MITYRYVKKRSLYYHMQQHSGNKPVCMDCGKIMNTYEEHATHMKEHDDEKPYKCLKCKESFSRKQQYLSHLIVRKQSMSVENLFWMVVFRDMIDIVAWPVRKVMLPEFMRYNTNREDMKFQDCIHEWNVLIVLLLITEGCPCRFIWENIQVCVYQIRSTCILRALTAIESYDTKILYNNNTDSLLKNITWWHKFDSWVAVSTC